MNTWNILYRGSLSSCNYECSYCPFGKTSNTAKELAQDAAEVHRFAEWAMQIQGRRIGILFTPWGEALIHRHYRETMLRLSHTPSVYRVAIQTNLSGPLDFLADANRDNIALWTTFHPTQVSLDRFAKQCQRLTTLGIRYSVGSVGMPEHLDDIEALRARLPPEVYLWINAVKSISASYTSAQRERMLAVDPYFGHNIAAYPSLGNPCHAGHTSFTVDANGDVRRCHFISRTIGNIYGNDIAESLTPTSCTQATCGCHIGYVHRPESSFDGLFGDGILDRIPQRWPQVEALFHAQSRSRLFPAEAEG